MAEGENIANRLYTNQASSDPNSARLVNGRQTRNNNNAGSANVVISRNNGDVHLPVTETLSSSSTLAEEERDVRSTVAEKPECPVCLQACVQPVRLPCSHIFCFLCLKGIALQNGRCALCRTAIPRDFLNDPEVLFSEDTSSKLASDCQAKGSYQWFYEGTAGWWQYEERNALELEEKHQSGVKTFEMVIVGLVFVIDLTHMVQYRRNDPNKRRRIKRDVACVSKKGIAGLKVHRSVERMSGDGGEAQPSSVKTPLLQSAPPPAIRNIIYKSAAVAAPSAAVPVTMGPPSINRRVRSLRRNGSDSDSALDEAEQQAVADSFPHRSSQRPVPIGDESSNSSSLRTPVGATTSYVFANVSSSAINESRESVVASQMPHTISSLSRATVLQDVRVIDGQESPLYYSGMTTPSNTPRSAASETGSPTERSVPPHSMHFEALIDGITGLVANDLNAEDRPAQSR